MSDNRAIRKATGPNEEEPFDPATDRARAFFKAGWSKDRYRYPDGAELCLEYEGEDVPILFSQIGQIDYETVRVRIKRLVETYPGCIISIKIPSKANTKRF